MRGVIVPNADPAWKPFLGTPGFPDFPSNHAVFSNSVAYALSSIYGSQTAFKNATYEGVMADLGSGPENLGTRQYASFDAMAAEISISRLYGGIHYRYSCEEGAKQGKKTAQNVDAKVKFLK
ncbi:MAG: phosphatase PAP2 family protein [Chitinophagaceae bacterium]|nr:MAG: phosphatase PAP2 family protein [Chitinophagaceae bacterium]